MTPSRYQVILTDCPYELELAVDKAISTGWEPLGGISIAMSYDNSEDRFIYSYAQAMIRTVPKK